MNDTFQVLCILLFSVRCTFNAVTVHLFSILSKLEV